jgi:hypothetical protein
VSTGSTGVTIDAGAFERYAHILEAHAGDLEKALQQGQEKAARPLAAYIVREGAAQMPEHGGLRAELKAAQAKVKVTTTGVEIEITTKQGIDLPALDDGLLHHLVFGRYVQGQQPQHVPAGAWSKAAEHHAEAVLPEAHAAVQAKLNTIAREASSA